MMDSISAFSTSPGLKGPATVLSNTSNIAGSRGNGPAAGVFSTMRYNLGNSPLTNTVATSGTGVSCNPMIFSSMASVNNTPMPPPSSMTVSAGTNAVANNSSTHNSSSNNSNSYHVTYGHHHVSTPILHGVTTTGVVPASGPAGLPIGSSTVVNHGGMMGYGMGTVMGSKCSNSISNGSMDHTSMAFSANSGCGSDGYHKSAVEEYNPATLEHWSRYGSVHVSGSMVTPTADEGSLKQVTHTLSLLQGMSESNSVSFWSKLVDPMLPIESAKEINRALASLSKLPQRSAAAYASIASCITTPLHLHMVTLLDRPHRDGIRDFVLQDLLEQLSTEVRQPLLGCAEMMAEMAKLSLIRLAGVAAMVEQFLDDPEKELAGLTILGRVAEHYYGTDTFRRAIRDMHAIEVSLDRLYHSVEYEADVVMIRRMLCVRGTAAATAVGGGSACTAGTTPSMSAAVTLVSIGETAGGGSSFAGGSPATGDHHSSAAAATADVYGATAGAEDRRVTTLHPLCALAHQSEAPATCMHYSHFRDEILSAHANGVIAVWGDPFDEEENEEGGNREEASEDGIHHYHSGGAGRGGDGGSGTCKREEGVASAAAHAVFRGHNGSFPGGGGSTHSRTSHRNVYSRDTLDPKPREEILLPPGCTPVGMTGHTTNRPSNYNGGSSDASSYYVAVACMSSVRHTEYNKTPHAAGAGASSPYSMHMTASSSNVLREPLVGLLACTEGGGGAGSAAWSLQATIKRPSAVAVTALVSVSSSLLSIAESILDGGSSVSSYGTATGRVSTGSVLRHDISLFDVHTAQQVSNIACAHNDYVTVLRTCEKDACIVFSGSRDGTVRVWDTRTATATSESAVTNKINANANKVGNNSFSTMSTFSGSGAAAGAGAGGVDATGHCVISSNGSVHSNKAAEAMQPLFCLPCKHEDTISCISTFSNYVFTGSLDGTVQLWDLRRMDSPCKSRSFLAPVLDVVAAALSTDGAQVAAVATARGLFLIDMESMSAVDVLPHSVCTQLAINETGSLIFALHSDGIRVHSLT